MGNLHFELATLATLSFSRAPQTLAIVLPFRCLFKLELDLFQNGAQIQWWSVLRQPTIPSRIFRFLRSPFAEETTIQTECSLLRRFWILFNFPVLMMSKLHCLFSSVQFKINLLLSYILIKTYYCICPVRQIGHQPEQQNKGRVWHKK